jgi:hypothetical protein
MVKGKEGKERKGKQQSISSKLGKGIIMLKFKGRVYMVCLFMFS